ncbi:hypothetical protein CAPTEDRAFT_225763 [Capitella teleta]|uniref:Ras-associating and dilute domain-containing protein n=1 Tax=Capitella teleta TaxID=283909 RepID=R7V9Q8_CAPTE|nr:hypothetical protein CAPTEDRAFT_225763 [Capitella teleta]|eukprot:ELU12480.1 hypothetical protein CAPTEDRAFT_225763 [Capitella teleta]
MSSQHQPSLSMDGDPSAGRKDQRREVRHVRQRSMHIVDHASMDKQRIRHKQKRRRRREVSLERSLPAEVTSTGLGQRDTALRSSRSVTNIFQKTFSLREKEHSFISSELSTVDSAPGVVKVFGESVCPGATYKSVLAVPSSSAQELVKEALDRYSISRRKATNFVLCDVIGKFIINRETFPVDNSRCSARKGVWTEECIRVIGDNEKPLILQSFWKPAEGFLRRFELRKRTQLLAMENIDTTTSGVNANARRLLLTKSKSQAVPGSLMAVQRGSDDMDIKYLHRKHPRNTQQRSKRQTHSEKNALPSTKVMAPEDSCYLLTIVSFNPKKDCLLHPLLGNTITIGDDPSNEIALLSPDIRPKHCLLHRSEKRSDKKGYSDSSWVLNTIDDGHATVNGCVVKKGIPLHSGDLLGLGQHYIFMFKDPDDEEHIASAISLNLTRQQSKGNFPVSPLPPHASPPCTSSYSSASPPPSAVRLPNPLVELQKEMSQKYDDCQRMKLVFHSHRELELLAKICSVTAMNPGSFVLSPAYLLAMAIEHSSAKHGQLQAKSFLLKVASHVQTSVWDCSKRMAENEADRSGPPKAIDHMKNTLVWLSNCLEIHHYMKTHLKESPLQHRLQSLPEETRASISAADREVSAVLDEVVIQTFQQTVYHTSKVLHEVILVIIDSSPFQDRNPQSNDQHGTGQVTQILTMLLEALTEHQVHPKVINQFFCYIFYFISNSLFNAVMTYSDTYMRWSKGVQIRGNLDFLESWAVDNAMQAESQQYLVKICSLANLLSTPKKQLQKLCLDELQMDYPELSRAQLIHVLMSYQADSTEPLKVDLPVDEAKPSAAEIHENFTQHPPLVIPKDGFQLNLQAQDLDAEFYSLLRCYNKEFKTKEDDVDSGLSISPGFGAIESKQQYHPSGVTKKRYNSDYDEIDDFLSPTSTTSIGDKTTKSAQCISSTVDITNGVPLYARINKGKSPKHCEEQSDVLMSEATPSRQHFPSRAHTTTVSAHNGRCLMQEHLLTNHNQWTHAVDSVLLTQKLNEIKSHDDQEPIYLNVPFLLNNCPDFGDMKRLERASCESTSSTLAHGESSNQPPGLPPSMPPPPVHQSLPGQPSRTRLKVPPTMAPKPKKKRPIVPPLDFTKLHSNVSPEEIEPVCTIANEERRSGVVNVGGNSSLLLTIGSQQNVDYSSGDEGPQDAEDLHTIELVMGGNGLGLGIMDGMYTSLRESGIYVRTLVPGGIAASDGRLRLGDRLLTVNGTNIMNADYTRAMKLIKRVQENGKVQFLVSSSGEQTISKIMGTPC